MIVTVRDPDILSNLEPEQLMTYLQEHGWHQERQVDNKESVWFKVKESGEEFDITLPLNPEIRAFALRMSEIIQTLELAEGISQLDIISDLITKLPNIKIQGMVSQIRELNQIRKVTIYGSIMGNFRKIHLHLKSPDYELAVKAYQERLPVICIGDLIKENDNFVLKEIHQFAVYSDT